MKYRFSKRKRFFCFFIGMLLSGIGVAFSTTPGLGTSPISSLPYVLTFIAPLSFGVWTVIINLVMLLAQVAILKKSFKWSQCSQIFAACLMGFFIDFGMWLSHMYIPENYILRLVEQLFGCALIAIGIGCELVADVTYMPGEGLVKTIAQRWKFNFGKVKIAFDSSLVVLAILLSLQNSGEITGIREGTIVAAFAVGFIVKQLHSPFRGVKRTLVKA